MKRGQAVLEFFSTYGWAFIVTITIVGAISYYGVTQPVTFLPNHCSFSSDIRCDDFLITTIDVPSLRDDAALGMVLIDVYQVTGRTAYLRDFSCEDIFGGQVLTYVQEGDDFSSLTGGFSSINNDIKPWDPEELITLKCLFNTNPFAGLDGELARVPLSITIQKREDGFFHRIEGELIGKVQ